MSLSTIRITPLSIVVAVCVFYAGYLLIGVEGREVGELHSSIKAIYTFILAIILFLTDILFRRFVPNMKWLWLIQGSFITLIIVMILIFQKI